jgi:hypothetical protein
MQAGLRLLRDSTPRVDSDPGTANPGDFSEIFCEIYRDSIISVGRLRA